MALFRTSLHAFALSLALVACKPQAEPAGAATPAANAAPAASASATAPATPAQATTCPSADFSTFLKSFSADIAVQEKATADPLTMIQARPGRTARARPGHPHGSAGQGRMARHPEPGGSPQRRPRGHDFRRGRWPPGTGPHTGHRRSAGLPLRPAPLLDAGQGGRPVFVISALVETLVMAYPPTFQEITLRPFRLIGPALAVALAACNGPQAGGAAEQSTAAAGTAATQPSAPAATPPQHRHKGLYLWAR